MTVESRVDPQQRKLAPFSTKTHHRVVFEEVGLTIREVNSLWKAFLYISQIVYGELTLASLNVYAIQ